MPKLTDRAPYVNCFLRVPMSTRRELEREAGIRGIKPVHLAREVLEIWAKTQISQ